MSAAAATKQGPTTPPLPPPINARLLLLDVSNVLVSIVAVGRNRLDESVFVNKYMYVIVLVDVSRTVNRSSRTPLDNRIPLLLFPLRREDVLLQLLLLPNVVVIVVVFVVFMTEFFLRLFRSLFIYLFQT